MPQDFAQDLFATPSGDKWRRLGARKRAGVLVPLFSVYSKKSAGIGEFGDLKLLVDWCKKSGNSILQLLPMNEVGGTYCPYDAVSSFALEPAYISLELLASSTKSSIKAKIADLKSRFPVGKARVNYGIREGKMYLLRDMYIEEGGDAKEFKNFIKENSYWLDDFALFKVLKAYHKEKGWFEWEPDYRNRDQDALKVFQKKRQDEILFQKWVQWIASNQFKDAKSYAESKDVLLKGDLPILISRDSADVWSHSDFFKLEFAAGAPPDMYCAKGQRWGMPTYNWEAIAADSYTYVKEKLKFAQNFYDVLRVDHVVGLFRIWSIPYNEPLDNRGLNGFFDPADESIWGSHGRQILSMVLNSTDILLCGEDLGIIPQVCPEALKEFGMPGNDVQRWVKDWSVAHDFLSPQDYRFLSVAVLSTHDTTNWAAWWENEAGTVDEALFIRKCAEKGIDYNRVKAKLFNSTLSKHGRLRWRANIASCDIFANILGRPKGDIMDFIDMYENTYKEKEKLWRHLKIKGAMREKSDIEIVKEALRITFESRSIFCIHLLLDYLYISDICKGNPYDNRINFPGTVSKDNWSLVVPVGLEALLAHPLYRDIRDMVVSSGRI